MISLEYSLVLIRFELKDEAANLNITANALIVAVFEIANQRVLASSIPGIFDHERIRSKHLSRSIVVERTPIQPPYVVLVWSAVRLRIPLNERFFFVFLDLLRI